jgi:hypothetical protein
MTRRRTLQPIPSASEPAPLPRPSRRSAASQPERRETLARRLWLAAVALVMMLSACSPASDLTAP